MSAIIDVVLSLANDENATVSIVCDYIEFIEPIVNFINAIF